MSNIQFLKLTLNKKKILWNIILPIILLVGSNLWPVNNAICRVLMIVSAVYLLAFLCIIWVKSYKKHKRITIFIMIIILVFFAYMSIGSLFEDEATTLELRKNYIQELKHYEGVRYVWGGENMLGMDCSGLPRKALRNALLKTAFTNGNGKYLRYAIKTWWLDASAEALANGYQHYVTTDGTEGTVSNASEHHLSPGDLAITEDGRHVMVFLEEDTWISADPLQGKVIIEKPSISHNTWFEAKVKFYTWCVLIPYHNY